MSLIERLAEAAKYLRDWTEYKRTADTIEEAKSQLEAMQAEIERLNERLVETQMRAHKWMEAHDKLQAGKPYEFPKPADVPDAIAEIDRLRAAITYAAETTEDQHTARKLFASLDNSKEGEK